MRREALILLYHRVTNLGTDPWGLAVQPKRFAEHLEVLNQYSQPIPLADLVHACRRGRIPRRAVVLTFDDGYVDNLYEAKPLLEQHQVPATVFVATRALESGTEFWWDELEALLLQRTSLPSEIRVCLRGQEYSWDLQDAVDPDAAELERNRTWRAWQPASSPRQHIYRDLWGMLHASQEQERQEILKQVRDAIGAAPASRPTHRLLSEGEITELARGGLVEIGAHTVNHPSLAAIPLNLQRDEIELSKARLETVLRTPVTAFSYPFGRSNDYTSGTLTLVEQAGFSSACTTTMAGVGSTSHLYQLPRITVPDIDGAGLMKLLSRYSPSTVPGMVSAIRNGN